MSNIIPVSPGIISPARPGVLGRILRKVKDVCTSGDYAARCEEVKKNCRQQCSDSSLPTGDNGFKNPLIV